MLVFGLSLETEGATWLDIRFLPAVVCLLSTVAFCVSWRRRLSSKIDQGSSSESLEDKSNWQKIETQVRARGGWTIAAFNLARLLGCVALTVLSGIAACLARRSVENGSGSLYAEVAVTAAYVYAAILSGLYFIVQPATWRKWKNAVASVLFAQFAIFAWRNLVPLTMFGGEPADGQTPWLLWSRGVLITLVGVIIPLFVPRQYVPVDPKNPMSVPSPEQTACLFSWLYYIWVDDLIIAANRARSLPFEDLPPLPDEDYASTLAARSMDTIDPIRRREQGLQRQHLGLGLLWVFRWEYVQMALFLVAQVLAKFLGPIGINRLLNYLETDGQGAVVRPWVWILCIFLAPTVNTMFFSLHVYVATRLIVQVESILVQLLLRHAFRIRITDDAPIATVAAESSQSSGHTTPVGSSSSTGSDTLPVGSDGDQGAVKPPAGPQKTELSASKSLLVPKVKASAPKAPVSKSVHLSAKINNMFGTDIGNIGKGSDAAALVSNVPLQFALCVAFLYLVLGWSALVGIFFMIITLPLPGLIIRRMQAVQRVQMQKTDQRVQTITESINLIRMIKARMFAWEPIVKNQVSARRDDELHYLQKRKLLNLATDILLSLLPMLSMTLSYAIYTLVMRQELDASKVFSSLPVFDDLSDNLSFTLEKVSGTIKAKVSLDRVTAFLYESSLLDRFATHSPIEGQPSPSPEGKIGFHRARFTWKDLSRDPSPPLRPYSLNLDELIFERGHINIIVGPTGCGKTSILMALLGEMHFIPQASDSWYSLPRDAGVAYAAQETWVQNETIKDNIIFGNLYDESRYKSVLRQCGLEPDLALFAAGDQTEVGEKGLTLSGGQKARITLARAVYSPAETVLLDDVLSALDVHTARCVVENCFKGGLLAGRTVILVTHAVALVAPLARKIVSMDASGHVRSQGPLSSTLSQDPILREELEQSETEIRSSEHEDRIDTDKKARQAGALILQEEMAEGRFRWTTMGLMLEAFGGMLPWLSSLAGLVAAVAADTIAMWWLGHWAEAYSSAGTRVNVAYYLSIFVGLVMIQQLSNGAGSAIYTFGTTRASRTIHAKLSDSILSSTFRWLDSTPMGRIISRFTQDITDLDNTIADTGQSVIRLSIKLILKFSAAIAFSPAFTLPGVLVTVLGMWLGHVYMIAQMSVKRIRSNWRSPLYNHLGASIAGLVSIRAFAAQDRFEAILRQRADRYSRTSRAFWILNRWIGVRMPLLGATFSASLAAYLTYTRRNVSASNTGFSLHMAVEFSGMILWWIRNVNGLEISANSLERIRDYLSIPHEPSPVEQKRAPAYWPASGSMQARGLCARYSGGGPFILKDLNFTIKSGERIGIVGRTGSGKSTLTLALLQLIPVDGELYLDGREAKNTNLQDWRSNITIIPQEPALLSGTIRSNLDPYDQHEDATLHNALKVTGLMGQAHDGAADRVSLETIVAHGGNNFSVGQRQLIALARAILRRTRVVILDEATASIDYQTDTAIQSSIRTELQHATLLTVAHRLSTIMDYDRIMVLSDGRIVEFDSPVALLADANGYFRSLVEKSNESEELIRLAYQAHPI